MRAELCCDALSMALGRRGPVLGVIHHSDRGSQYAGTQYRKLIKKAGLTQSPLTHVNMCCRAAHEPQGPVPGQCADGKLLCIIEKELIHRQRFRTRAQAKAAIFEYIDVFYNRQRRHSAIGYQTPQQAFNNMTWKMVA